MVASDTPIGPSARVAGRAARVMIVDPDARFAGLLGTYLAAKGWVVERFVDPGQALAKLDDRRPDVVLVELVGPEPIGLHFAGLVRLRPTPPAVVICTRLVAPQAWDAPTLHRLGVHALVVRPLPFGQIEQVIGTCASRPLPSPGGAPPAETGP